MPDVRFYPFVDGTSMSQSVVNPFKHNTVGSRRGNVRWDLNIPVGAKGLSMFQLEFCNQLIVCCCPLDR